eukprot:TRINITY_DN5299_c0_g1_i1.p1 TRINITY_DN5299_c0_g1~~TRINITY_DN5299_c0_g1_i1.p1  ORF type:complete len:157 (-),score=9.76 TRINITY_DN5299_c0_g1_i1:34-504(-)
MGNQGSHAGHGSHKGYSNQIPDSPTVRKTKHTVFTVEVAQDPTESFPKHVILELTPDGVRVENKQNEVLYSCSWLRIPTWSIKRGYGIGFTERLKNSTETRLFFFNTPQTDKYHKSVTIYTNQLSSDLHRRQQENMSHAEEPIEIEVDGEISLSNQ